MMERRVTAAKPTRVAVSGGIASYVRTGWSITFNSDDKASGEDENACARNFVELKLVLIGKKEHIEYIIFLCLLMF